MPLSISSPLAPQCCPWCCRASTSCLSSRRSLVAFDLINQVVACLDGCTPQTDSCCLSCSFSRRAALRSPRSWITSARSARSAFIPCGPRGSSSTFCLALPLPRLLPSSAIPHLPGVSESTTRAELTKYECVSSLRGSTYELPLGYRISTRPGLIAASSVSINGAGSIPDRISPTVPDVSTPPRVFG